MNHFPLPVNKWQLIELFLEEGIPEEDHLQPSELKLGSSGLLETL
ncbi:MAG: hypothetical protein RIG62_23450 [Cyclobacteriaceae bacterium]